MMALGAMCDVVLRDLSNVLCAVVGFAQLVQLEAASPQAAEYARQIQRAGRHGSELAARIQAFATREAIGAEAIDLRAEIDQMKPMIQGLAGAHVRVGFEAAANRQHAFVDPVLLEELIVALCLHGRDAMPQGGHLRWIVRNPDTVECLREGVANQVVLEVLDTGHRSAGDADARGVVAHLVTSMGGRLLGERGDEVGNRLRCLLPVAA